MNEVVTIYKKYNGQDTVWTASNVATLYKQLKEKYKYPGKIAVKIDDGGVGGGVVDQLKNLKKIYPDIYKDMEVIPVNFGQPIKHIHYADSTTYMMSIVRDLIAPFDEQGNKKSAELILPNDNDLIGQLSCRKYTFDGAKQKVESKKEMKKRGLTSPDEADCILLICLPVKFKRERRE